MVRQGGQEGVRLLSNVIHPGNRRIRAPNQPSWELRECGDSCASNRQLVTAAIASRSWPAESEDSCVVNSGMDGLLLEELLSACPDFYPRRSYRHLTRATNLPRRQK